MEIKEFDIVLLKDGREASIVDKLGKTFVAEVGESEADYETILVEPEEIERILSQ